MDIRWGLFLQKAARTGLNPEKNENFESTFDMSRPKPRTRQTLQKLPNIVIARVTPIRLKLEDTPFRS